MPAEYRRAVVAAARVAAGQLPAVLPEPAPQRGLAGLCERVSADADYPAVAIRAVLTVFEEEVEALRWAAGPAGAVRQVPRPAELGGQLIQDPVERIGVGLVAAARAVHAVTSGVLGVRNRMPSVLWRCWSGLAA